MKTDIMQMDRNSRLAAIAPMFDGCLEGNTEPAHLQAAGQQFQRRFQRDRELDLLVFRRHGIAGRQETGDEFFHKQVRYLAPSHREMVFNRYMDNRHDLGFLYLLCAVSRCTVHTLETAKPA